MSIKNVSGLGEATDDVEEIDEVAAPEVEEADAEQAISVDDLLSTDELGVTYIPLPQPWGRGIKARPLTMNEIAEVRKAGMQKVRNSQGKLVDVPSQKRSNIALIRLSLVDPVLTEAQIAQLFQKNNKLLKAILEGLMELNGIGAENTKEVADEAMATFQD